MGARQAKTNQAGKRKATQEEIKAVTQEITDVLQDNLHVFIDAENAHIASTGKERQRLFGAGVKNYGFIEKAFDIARDNPGSMPPYLHINDLRGYLDDLDEMRQLYFILESFEKTVFACYLQRTDKCYRTALRVYAALKEQARGRVPGAAPLYEALKPFFHHRKRQTDKPTNKQVIKDFKKLIHNKADGEIVIKNERPRVVKGSRTVVDEIDN